MFTAKPGEWRYKRDWVNVGMNFWGHKDFSNELQWLRSEWCYPHDVDRIGRYDPHPVSLSTNLPYSCPDNSLSIPNMDSSIGGTFFSLIPLIAWTNHPRFELDTTSNSNRLRPDWSSRVSLINLAEKNMRFCLTCLRGGVSCCIMIW